MIPKLRAYDKVTQKIFDVEYINFTEQVVSLGGCRSRYFHEVEPMQFTGLYDKNGDEIFEGDIIRIDGGDYGDDTAVVDFVDGGFFADYHDLVTEFELLHSIALPIEIIGNIYENKEILEG